MKRPLIAALIAGTLLGAGVVALAQGKSRLTVLQNTVPTDARKIGGKLYVPIADVAKAMGWKLSVSGGNISLQPPVVPPKNGGNTSLSGSPYAGKLGEEIRTDAVRFTATKLVETDRHERVYIGGVGVGTPVLAGAGEKLVVIHCTLTNATADREQFCFSRDAYAENTALLDVSGESLPPAAVDVAADELSPPGAVALAGATIRFALVFRVPKTWQPKALVYTVVRYRARGQKRGVDVRVNL